MVHMIGISFGILLTGIALTLGISSIILLFSKRPLSKQDNFFCVFTTVLLVLAIGYQAEALLNAFLPFISSPIHLTKGVKVT